MGSFCMTLEDNSSLLKLERKGTVHAVLFSMRGQLCCVMLFSHTCVNAFSLGGNSLFGLSEGWFLRRGMVQQECTLKQHVWKLHD